MAGAGPVDDRDGAKDGMAPSDRQLMELCLRDPRRAARLLRVQGLVTRVAPALAVRSLAGELSAADRAALADGTGRATMRSFVEAMRQGGGGVVADYRLYASPWGVAWSAVGVPVEIFQGDADGFVPMHHAEDFVGPAADRPRPSAPARGRRPPLDHRPLRRHPRRGPLSRGLSLAFNLAVPCLAVLCRSFGVSSGHGTATA